MATVSDSNRVHGSPYPYPYGRLLSYTENIRCPWDTPKVLRDHPPSVQMPIKTKGVRQRTPQQKQNAKKSERKIDRLASACHRGTQSALIKNSKKSKTTVPVKPKLTKDLLIPAT